MNLFNAYSDIMRRLSSQILSGGPESDEKWKAKAVKSLVKRLKRSNQLDELVKAITEQNPNTRCVTIPRSQDGRLQIAQKKGIPHVFYCRLWRWTDLHSQHELKPVESCQYHYHAKQNEVCINPYHYTRVDYPTVMVPKYRQVTNSSIGDCVSRETTMTGLNPSSMEGSSATYTTTSLLSHNIFPRMANSNSSDNDTNQMTYSPMDESVRHDLYNNLDSLTPPRDSNGNTNNAESQPFGDISSVGTLRNTWDSLNSPVSPNDSSASLKGIAVKRSNESFNLMTSLRNMAGGEDEEEGEEDDDGAKMEITEDLGRNGAHPPGMSLENNTILEKYLEECSQFEPTNEFNSVPYEPHENWCRISYYEYNHRVGDTFCCWSPQVVVDGFTSPSEEERFCLGMISNPRRLAEAESARTHIGKGLMLQYCFHQVFLECLSDQAIFVQSANCNVLYNWRVPTVVKVPRNCNLCIFDDHRFGQLLKERVANGFESVYELQKMCVIRISFVKGWGARYKRQLVTDVPCWIELHLTGPLQWLDRILQSMGSSARPCTSRS